MFVDVISEKIHRMFLTNLSFCSLHHVKERCSGTPETRGPDRFQRRCSRLGVQKWGVNFLNASTHYKYFKDFSSISHNRLIKKILHVKKSLNFFRLHFQPHFKHWKVDSYPSNFSIY